MTGKKIVFILIAFCIIVLILGWLWLQNIMNKYELEEANDFNPQITYKLEQL